MTKKVLFFKIGGILWALAVGLSALVLFVQVLSSWEFPSAGWRYLWLLAGGGGLACMIFGAVFSIWDV